MTLPCPLPFSSRVFFLLTLPTLSSPLFPYTTLFRSHPRTHVSRPCDKSAMLLPHRAARAPQPTRLSTPPDRKSTRLNSSHTVISYAVFCLKKKNKEHNFSAL